MATHDAAGLVSPLAMRLATRLMGLLLGAIAVQFIMDGLAKTPFFAP